MVAAKIAVSAPVQATTADAVGADPIYIEDHLTTLANMELVRVTDDKNYIADLIILDPKTQKTLDDRSPSLVVTPSKNLWHCLGACQEGGDIFKFIMRLENLSFGEAVQSLAQRLVISGSFLAIAVNKPFFAKLA